MKITLTVDVVLWDLRKARSRSINQRVGTMTLDDGTEFEISQPMGDGLRLTVHRSGSTHEAMIDLRPLVENAGVEMVRHAADIDAEDSSDGNGADSS
jgi:hypothetical protein